MQFFRKKRPSAISAEQREHWEESGYLVLSSFFTRDEVEAVNELVTAKTNAPSTFGNASLDVLHGKYTGQRLKAREAPAEAFTGPIKINDLFLDEPTVRHLALSSALTAVLDELLDGAPMVCNSLNFLWGSQQPDHFDSWYMPPPVPNKMVVSSICLENVRPDAGPLVYYAGSHKIAPYQFSHGGIHAVDAEMPACRAYVEEKVSAAGCERKVFLGNAGDVFLWHGQLLHGGTGITNISRTRKTLVTHYWRAQDVEPALAAKVHDNGFYLRRDHH